LHSVAGVTQYKGVAKDILQRLKFERARAGAEDVARILVSAYTPGDDVLVTHIPTAASRVRQRGYDQAELIARAFARLAELPYAPLLVRIGNQRQVGQHREVRTQQMQQAFRPIHITSLQNRHILLIDDVLTTGATCEAAARTLRQAGAKRVSAAVFAVA
jgi:ComF family protein